MVKRGSRVGGLTSHGKLGIFEVTFPFSGLESVSQNGEPS